MVLVHTVRMVRLGQCPSGAKLATGGSCEVSVVSVPIVLCDNRMRCPLTCDASPRTMQGLMDFAEAWRSVEFVEMSRRAERVAEARSRQMSDVGR